MKTTSSRHLSVCPGRGPLTDDERALIEFHAWRAMPSGSTSSQVAESVQFLKAYALRGEDE